MGRKNYGPDLWDPKGVHGDVSLNGAALQSADGWIAWNLPLLDVSQRLPREGSPVGSCSTGGNAPTTEPHFYRGTIDIQPARAADSADVKDTFLVTKQWGRGIVWINGFNIGR